MSAVAAQRFSPPALERLSADAATAQAAAEIATRLLAAVEALATRCRQCYRKEVEAYAEVADEELREYTIAGLSAGLAALADLREPTEEEINRTRMIGHERARQRMPIDAMMQTWLIATRETIKAWDREAAAAGLAPEVSILARDFASAWANFMMATAAQAHRETELDLAREDDERRTRVLRRLLWGPVDDAALHEAAAYGVSPEHPYAPLRARGMRVAASRVEHELMASGATDGREPVLCRMDGDIVGVAPRIPDCPEGALLVVTDPVALAHIDHAHSEIERAFETAVGVGTEEGVLRPEDLHLLPLVAGAHDIGDRLVARHLAPVESDPRGQALLTTAERYLANGRRIEATARELHLHPNSVRHRLARLEEQSGLDLRRTDHLVVLWWTLRRRAMARRTEGDSSATPDGA